MRQIRPNDTLNEQEEKLINILKENESLGYGRMIQLIRYLWTDSLVEQNTFAHLGDKEREFRSSQLGSGEISI